MSVLPTPIDMITLLCGQHRGTDQLLVRLDNHATADADQAETMARRVVIDLMKHAVAEEVYLYPLVREKLPNGDALADREIAEHDEGEVLMKQLEKLSPGDAEWQPTVHRLASVVRGHVQEEERILFPALMARCTSAELLEIGTKMRAVQATAPTRPHPGAPSEGTALQVLGPGAGLVDRVRDVLSGRGR